LPGRCRPGNLLPCYAPRQTPAGYVYHALNRATARLKLFRKAADYAAFLRVFDEGFWNDTPFASWATA
jgi:hypothetical protein